MTVNFPKEKIATGEKQTISVTFDSKGKEGLQRKTVSVKTNAYPTVQVLNFSLEVFIE